MNIDNAINLLNFLRLYSELPEVKQQAEDKKKEEIYKTNRLKARLFKQVCVYVGRLLGGGGVKQVSVHVGCLLGGGGGR